MSTTTSQINTWGNGLAFRLTRQMAKAAGLAEGSRVRVTVKPGQIVLQAESRPTLAQMLAKFDPAIHGGEVMADAPVGVEVIS